MASSNSKPTFEIDNLIRVRETTHENTFDEKPVPPRPTAPSQPTTQSSYLDVNHKFDGGRHWMKGRWYLNPTLQDVGLTAPLPVSEKTHHRDILGRITQRPRDLLRYISPTYGKPVHILVQATPQAYRTPQGDWRRVKLKGTAPTLLRLSVWALGDGEPSSNDIVWIIGKVILTIPAQLCVLMWPFTRSRLMHHAYPAFPSRSWDYPKYARNSLDADPNAQTSVSWNGAVYDVTGDQTRLIQPRQLMIDRNGTWTLSPGTSQPYIVISYTTKHFKPDAAGRGLVEKLAEQMAREAGVDAYWLDYKCRAAEQPMLTDDVHRLCDVFRGARQVCVVLPNLTLEKKQEWGCRMWTLTEVLLSASPKIKFCSPEMTEEYSKLELAAGVWTDGEPTRLLAEHYSGLLTLSRLELISLGLKALSCRRSEKEWTPGDIAYALMALLRYRPRMNPEDTLFQALARLSLANDSDRIVERMVCMLPDPTKTHHTPFVLEDILGAKLWDIEPLCQVAGVGDGNEIILDGCRAVSIRWKDIPRIEYVGRKTWKKFGATVTLHSGPFWFLLGVIVAAAGQASPGLVGFGVVLILIGLALAIAAPWSVVTLHGGKVWGQSPWLIGFEGTLPIKEIEHLTFGNAIGRFSYAASSGLLGERDPKERIGRGPAFIEHPETAAPPSLPAGHRLFTLIDTGTMTISVFSAARPPSVALICGSEGGMLRVLMCSYERSTNCLHKETVLRMETPMLSKAARHAWLKLA